MKTFAKNANDKTTRLQSSVEERQALASQQSTSLAVGHPQAQVQAAVQQMAGASPQAAKINQLQAMADGGHPNRTGLPDNLKAGIENLSGYSMDEVKVHYNSDKPATLQAHAYAQGTDIHLAPGQEQHLPHEAWHVVQQKQGRVKATTQLKDGLGVNDDESLEREADKVKSLLKSSIPLSKLDSAESPISLSNIVQCVSAFSLWFIKDVLIPTLNEITKEDEAAPGELDAILDEIAQLLGNEDNDTDSSTAISALTTVFEELEENISNAVLGFIITDQIVERMGLETRWEENRKEIATWLKKKRSQLLALLPDENLSSEEDTPDDLQTVFETYPKLTDPIRRPGHLNPYRHGIGAADTIATLTRNRLYVISRIGGTDSDFVESLESKFLELDAQIKEINDEEEKPLLQQIIELNSQRDKLLDQVTETNTSIIDDEIIRLNGEISTIREGRKKELREELRRLYEQAYWISQRKDEDIDEEARTRQVKEFFNLSRDEEFATSFLRAQEATDEYFDESEGIPPKDTSHHSEQRILVSKQWQLIRTEVLEGITNALLENKETGPTSIADLVSPLVISMSINRSSCYTCNAFLVAELINLWKEITQIIGGDSSWQDVRDTFRPVFTFEVTYSIPYTKVKSIEELNSQLRLAGWNVYQHDETEASSDEEEHEKLSTGSIFSKGKRKRKKKSVEQESSDSEFFPSDDEDDY